MYLYFIILIGTCCNSENLGIVIQMSQMVESTNTFLKSAIERINSDEIKSAVYKIFLEFKY